MLVAGDLGFSSLVLVVCLIFPVIGFIIRRKWHLAIARKEEIKRLLVLASEEAARAELESSVGYGAVSSVSISISRSYQCTVCYCPTTTRCARCKAVRYCSGKCQIIHWRQGHKEECRPPSITHQINDEGSDSGLKVAEQDQYENFGDKSEIEGWQHVKLVETLLGAPALPNSTSSLEVPLGKDDDIKVEFRADREETNSTSESTDSSFSGFSASSTSSESSDDVSVCESISSNEPEKLDGPLSVDIALDMLETAPSVNNVDQTKPLSPKFASLVDSVDNFTKLNNSNQIKSGHSGGESQCTSTISSGLDIPGTDNGPIAERCTSSSGFWGRTLESMPRDNACNNSALSNSNGTSNSKLSDSESSLLFSFNFSGSTSPPLHAQGSEVRGIDDALPAALGSNKPANGVAVSDNFSVDSLKVSNSPSINCKMSNHVENGTSSGSHISKSRDVNLSSSSPYVHPPSSAGGNTTSKDPSHFSRLPSSSSAKSNHIVNGPVDTPHLLRSREAGCLTSYASDAQLSSSASLHSVPSVKSGKVDGIPASASISSQVASCSPNGRNGLKTSMWKVVDQFRGSKVPKYYPLGVGSETAGRYSDKGLFPYELFVKLYTWNKVELHPCGLKNCGNSCFANAVLQCLAVTPPLTAYFLQGLHSKACLRKEWCFTCEFENLISKAKEGKSPFSPINILSQLRNSGSNLGNGREEDAHEFLRYAIDTMQSVCLKEAGVNASGSSEEETTLIGLAFGGYLRSKIKCMKCQGKSERHERMMDLTVEIEGDIGTLGEALRRFTSTEILDGENKYHCGRCKSYEKAKKKLTILEAPNVLTIALKRFQSGKFGKLNKPIQFPEILDLAPYMSGTSDKSPIYRLYGVVVHLDIMNAAFSGHYVCYVKNIQNKWFKIDDSTVTAVELERVLTKGAYMLLYARCSPRAPRLVRNRIISPDLKHKAIPSRVDGKNSTSKPRSASTHTIVTPFNPSSIPPDVPASIESFYSKFHRLQRILEEDLSSDSSSLISSNSDEGSCSTDSTRDSTSADDLSDYIFGDSGRGWNSPWRSSSDSDTSSSSSSSPLCARHSPLADSDRYASGSPETSGSQTHHTDSAIEGDGLWDRLPSGTRRRLDDLGSKGGDPFWYSDATKQCRNLGSSGCTVTDSQRLGWVNPLKDIKSGLSLRKSTRERTD